MGTWYSTRNRICDHIERGATPQQVAGRYRAALRRDEVETDSDYAALMAAKNRGLDRLRDRKRATATKG